MINGLRLSLFFRARICLFVLISHSWGEIYLNYLFTALLPYYPQFWSTLKNWKLKAFPMIVWENYSFFPWCPPAWEILPCLVLEVLQCAVGDHLVGSICLNNNNNNNTLLLQYSTDKQFWILKYNLLKMWKNQKLCIYRTIKAMVISSSTLKHWKNQTEK